jgi:dynein heavy chain
MLTLPFVFDSKLLRRLQEANEACNSVRLDVASTKLFRKTIRISTSTEETLHDYINLWYKSWCDSVEITRSGLQATVLIKHPDTLKLTVNFDVEIIKLIAEAKGFQRLGFLLPSGAKRLIQNENTIKRHRDELLDMINNFHRVQYRLDAGLKSILFNVIHDIDLRFVRPNRFLSLFLL